MLGNCKWFNYNKGYGFIRAKGREDIFVHFSNIHTAGYRFLKVGEPVEFTRIMMEKGVQAVDVVRLRPEILSKEDVYERYLGIKLAKHKHRQLGFVK